MTSEALFESIQDYFNDAMPFAIYRKPNATLVNAIFQNDDTIYRTSNFTESGFVFAPFEIDKGAVLIPLEKSEQFVVLLEAEDNLKKHKDDNSNDDDKPFYIDLIQKGINAINSKQFQKVVLSRSETIKLSEAHFIEVFKRLLNAHTTAFVYCWYHPKVGLWLGATPETLLETQGNRFSTMALAGTQKFKGTLDVVWKDKEKEEQQIVTDFVVESLKPSVENLNVSEVTTVKAGGLLHLQTKISGMFKILNFKQILEALHPTPAICGFPKTKAKQFILEHENYKREFYAGFLGELNLKEKKTRNTNRRNVENNAYASIKTVTNLYVNLRCMQFKNGHAIVYVGGGITKDSNPEAEWEETINKTQTIKNSL
jgi:isochorismate synthase